MESTLEYISDLPVESIESRNFHTDESAFEHNIRENESDEYYRALSEKIDDPQAVCDRILGDGWEKLDEVASLKSFVKLYSKTHRPSYLKKIFENLHIQRDRISKHRDSINAPRTLKPSEDLPTYDLIQENRKLMQDVQVQAEDIKRDFDIKRIRQMLGELNSEHHPDNVDMELLENSLKQHERGYMTPIREHASAMQTMTPIKQPFKYTEPEQDVNQTGSIETFHSVREPVVMRDEIDYDEKASEVLPSPAESLSGLEMPILVRTSQIGLPKTIYLYNRKEVQIPEPSMHDRHRLFSHSTRKTRPATTNTLHEKRWVTL